METPQLHVGADPLQYVHSHSLFGHSLYRLQPVNTESLPEASEAQLARLDDVCAICYQEMRTAKITRCNHFFHGVCLRKWLYVQVSPNSVPVR